MASEQPVYDSMFKIAPQEKGWGTEATIPAYGIVPELISESLARGEQVKERDARIVAGRFIESSMITKEQDQPAGDVVMAPRIADLPIPLMLAFQCRNFDGTDTTAGTVATGTHSGTLTFVPIDHPVDWVGSTWGTINNGTDGQNGTVVSNDVYPASFIRANRTLTGHSFAEYIDGISDVLTFTQTYNEDLQITMGNKVGSYHSISKTAAQFDTALGKAPDLTANYLSDWNGTFTLDGTTYDLQAWTFTHNNNCADRGRLGKQGFSKFPFGRPVLEGNMEQVLGTGINSWVAGGTAKLEAKWNCSDGWIKVTLPRVVWRARDFALSSGEDWIMRPMPFRAVPGASGTPAIIVQVFGTWIGSYYTDSLFSAAY